VNLCHRERVVLGFSDTEGSSRLARGRWLGGSVGAVATEGSGLRRVDRLIHPR
jgi:hypothetical protein